LFFAVAWTLTCSLLLGGGASNVYLTNALVQVLALPCLIVALWRLGEGRVPPAARAALVLIGATLLLNVAQLLPLPPSLWSVLPFRDRAVSALAALGEAKKWAPLSLTPEATIVGQLTLIAPVTLFMGVVFLGFRERRLLTLILLAFGFVNAFLGLAQLSQGPDGTLFFYRYGGTGQSVGLFANRNHEAALLYSLTPLAAAWIGGLAPAITIRGRKGKVDSKALIKLLAAGVTIFVLVVAALMTRSRAGVILLMAALLGGMVLQPWRQLRAGQSRTGGIYIIVAALAMALGLQYGLYQILMRFEADPLGDARVAINATTAAAAWKALPWGTGLGSFVSLYPSIERPVDVLTNAYINLAHDDPLQVALEAGAPGIMLMAGFFGWFLLRCRAVWRGDRGAETDLFRQVTGDAKRDATEVDLLIARAATISLVLLTLHSLVDYPLRTNALMSLYAVFCAFLVPPNVKMAAPHRDDTPAPVAVRGAFRAPAGHSVEEIADKG
jgi:O-antigen ligase